MGATADIICLSSELRRRVRVERGLPSPLPTECSVFLGDDIVLTRKGETPVSALMPSMEVLTRSGFCTLHQKDHWSEDHALIELPATRATRGSRYVGDPRRYLFVCGAEVELATGAAGGLLYLADLWPLARQAVVGIVPTERYALRFARPEILLSPVGDLANATGGEGSRVLTPYEAIVVFQGMARDRRGLDDA